MTLARVMSILAIFVGIGIMYVGESAPAFWNTTGFLGDLRAFYRGMRWFWRMIYGLGICALVFMLMWSTCW